MSMSLRLLILPALLLILLVGSPALASDFQRTLDAAKQGDAKAQYKLGAQFSGLTGRGQESLRHSKDS